MEIELRRGISHARNRCVALAADCELICFIDDDEVARPRWLSELLSAIDRYQADVVTGPVDSAFESPPPDWVAQGRFFDRSRLKTGTLLDTAKTGNVIIRKAILDRVPGPFDHRFALTGGEDAFLFMRMHQQGARILWCDEAVAIEYVPEGRVRLPWIVKRAFRTGSTITRIERILQPAGRDRLIRICKGFGKITIGTAALPIRAGKGRAGIVLCLCEIAYGAGCIAGCIGYCYQVYRDA